MAVRSAVMIDHMDGMRSAVWEGLLDDNSDSGSPVAMGNIDGLCVQVLGNFGTSGAVTMQGSNDGGTTWFSLIDTAGTAVVLDTSTRSATIASRPLLIRPLITAGSGTVDLDVYLAGARRGS